MWKLYCIILHKEWRQICKDTLQTLLEGKIWPEPAWIYKYVKRRDDNQVGTWKQKGGSWRQKWVKSSWDFSGPRTQSVVHSGWEGGLSVLCVRHLPYTDVRGWSRCTWGSIEMGIGKRREEREKQLRSWRERTWEGDGEATLLTLQSVSVLESFRRWDRSVLSRVFSV